MVGRRLPQRRCPGWVVIGRLQKLLVCGRPCCCTADTSRVEEGGRSIDPIAMASEDGASSRHDLLSPVELPALGEKGRDRLAQRRAGAGVLRDLALARARRPSSSRLGLHLDCGGIVLGKIPVHGREAAGVRDAVLELAAQRAEAELVPARPLARLARVQRLGRLQQRAVPQKDDPRAVDDVGLDAAGVKVLLNVLSLHHVMVHVSPDLHAHVQAQGSAQRTKQGKAGVSVDQCVVAFAPLMNTELLWQSGGGTRSAYLQHFVRRVVPEAVLADGLAAASDAEEGALVLLRVRMLLTRVEEVLADELEKPSFAERGKKRERRKSGRSIDCRRWASSEAKRHAHARSPRLVRPYLMVFFMFCTLVVTSDGLLVTSSNFT